MNFQAFTRTSNEIICHINDDNIYNEIILKNGIKALIISTSQNKTGNASIALSVEAGSFNDPEDLPGLTHLLSSILASEENYINISLDDLIKSLDKTVKENDKGLKRKTRTTKPAEEKENQINDLSKSKILCLQDFLDKVNGEGKFATDYEYTTFELKFDNANIDETIERFSKCFCETPEISVELIEKVIEKNNKEYESKKESNPLRQIEMLIGKLSKQITKLNKQQMSKFPILNEIEKTFKKDLRLELFKYLKQHFTGNRIKIILKSDNHIESLKNILNNCFSKLPKSVSNKSNKETGLNKCCKRIVKEKTKAFCLEQTNNVYFLKSSEYNLNERNNSSLNFSLSLNESNEEDLSKGSIERNNLFDVVQATIKEPKFNMLAKFVSDQIVANSISTHITITTSSDTLINNSYSNTPTLFIILNFSCLRQLYPIMPFSFIASLICKEDEDCLLRQLKKNNLILDLEAGNVSDYNFANNGYSNLFFIVLSLTQQGLSQIESIVQNVFHYIKFLANNLDFKKSFDEYAKLMALKYHFKELSHSSEQNLFKLVKNMHFFPATDVLIMNKFPISNENLFLIGEMLKSLTLNNATCVLFSDDEFENQSLEEENFNGISYKSIAISSLWKNNVEYFEFCIPKPNVFVPNELTIKVEKSKELFPVILAENNVSRLWFKKDNIYLTPLTTANLLIVNDLIRISAEYAVIADLFLLILQDSLASILSHIKEAGASYKIEIIQAGIAISLSGFHDKFLDLFEKIISSFKISINKIKFDRQKSKLKNSYEQFLGQKLGLLCDLEKSFFYRHHWNVEQKMYKLSTVTENDISKFIKDLFKYSFREYLIQGNYTNANAKRFYNTIEKKFSKNGKTKLELICSSLEIVKMPRGVWNCVAECRRPVEINQQMFNCYIENNVAERSFEEEKSKNSQQMIENKISRFKTLSSTVVKDNKNRSERLFIDHNQTNISTISKNSSLKNATFIFNNTKYSVNSNTSLNKEQSFSDVTCGSMSIAMDQVSSNDLNMLIKNSQIVSNFYVIENVNDSFEENCLIQILVKLISKHIISFFRNDNGELQKHLSSFWINKVFDKPVCLMEKYQQFLAGHVDCKEFDVYGQQGFIICICDFDFSMTVAKIDACIQEFLSGYIFNIVQGLTQQMYLDLVEEILNEKQKQTTFFEEVNQNWIEIVNFQKRFDRKIKEINFLKESSHFEYFISWACYHLQQMPLMRKLSIQIVNENHIEKSMLEHDISSLMENEEDSNIEISMNSTGETDTFNNTNTTDIKDDSNKKDNSMAIKSFSSEYCKSNYIKFLKPKNLSKEQKKNLANYVDNIEMFKNDFYSVEST